MWLAFITFYSFKYQALWEKPKRNPKNWGGMVKLKRIILDFANLFKVIPRVGITYMIYSWQQRSLDIQIGGIMPICLLIICSLLVGCSTPKYVAPADPFEINHYYYTANQERMKQLTNEMEDVNFTRDYTEAELDQNIELIRGFIDLSQNGHIPARHLLGMYQVAFGLGTNLELNNPKTRSASLRIIKKEGKTEKEAKAEADKIFDIGVENIYESARTGYQESVSMLKLIEVDLPAVDRQPRAVAQAQRAYQNDVNKNDTMLSNIGTAVVVAALIGGAIAVAAKHGGGGGGVPTTSYKPVNNNNLFDSIDFRGCCSYHDGISHDLFGNEHCSIFGAVLCNDGNPSPTCRCN